MPNVIYVTARFTSYADVALANTLSSVNIMASVAAGPLENIVLVTDSYKVKLTNSKTVYPLLAI